MWSPSALQRLSQDRDLWRSIFWIVLHNLLLRPASYSFLLITPLLWPKDTSLVPNDSRRLAEVLPVRVALSCGVARRAPKEYHVMFERCAAFFGGGGTHGGLCGGEQSSDALDCAKIHCVRLPGLRDCSSVRDALVDLCRGTRQLAPLFPTPTRVSLCIHLSRGSIDRVIFPFLRSRRRRSRSRRRDSGGDASGRRFRSRRSSSATRPGSCRGR